MRCSLGSGSSIALLRNCSVNLGQWNSAHADAAVAGLMWLKSVLTKLHILLATHVASQL